MRKRLTDAVTVSGYKLGSLAARMMPGPVALGAASSIAFTASFANSARRRMLERHLQRVNPRLHGTALRVAVRPGVRQLRPVLHGELPAADDAGAHRRPRLPHRRVRPRHRLARGRARARSSPCRTSGDGSGPGRWMVDQGYQMTVVVEALDPPELFEWFAELRQDLGMTGRARPAPKAGPTVIKALRDNDVVCLLCDRDLDRNGVEVEFFGERTTLPAGPAMLALRTGRAAAARRRVLHRRATTATSPSSAHRSPPSAAARLRDDVARITQSLAHELEFLIRRAPEQWHLFQPNWPTDPGYYD